MPSLTFSPDALRRGFALARIVKPETSDFSVRFAPDGMFLFSHDKRRFSHVRVPTEGSDCPSGWRSDEWFVTVDRASLFDSDLEKVSISVNEKSLSILAEGGGQVRKASLKQRAQRSRRPAAPVIPDLPAVLEASPSVLDSLLKALTPSALVSEKTEQDMRVNQVHFYPEKSCAVAHAGAYATVAFLDGMGVDLSIVSVDLPSIRAFCSKASGETVSLMQDKHRLFVRDPSTGSCLAFSRVASKKPPLQLLDEAGFENVVRVDHGSLLRSLNWATVAMEGTQRLSVSFQPEGDSGEIVMSNGTQELSRLPATRVSGRGFSSDFPCRHFASLVHSVDGDVLLCFRHKDAPTMLSIRSADPGSVRCAHFMQSMVSR